MSTGKSRKSEHISDLQNSKLLAHTHSRRIKGKDRDGNCLIIYYRNLHFFKTYILSSEHCIITSQNTKSHLAGWCSFSLDIISVHSRGIYLYLVKLILFQQTCYNFSTSVFKQLQTKRPLPEFYRTLIMFYFIYSIIFYTSHSSQPGK